MEGRKFDAEIPLPAFSINFLSSAKRASYTRDFRVFTAPSSGLACFSFKGGQSYFFSSFLGDIDRSWKNLAWSSMGRPRIRGACPLPTFLPPPVIESERAIASLVRLNRNLLVRNDEVNGIDFRARRGVANESIGSEGKIGKPRDEAHFHESGKSVDVHLELLASIHVGFRMLTEYNGTLVHATS